MLILEKFKQIKEISINIESVPNVKLMVLAFDAKVLATNRLSFWYLHFLLFNKMDNNISEKRSYGKVVDKVLVAGSDTVSFVKNLLHKSITPFWV